MKRHLDSRQRSTDFDLDWIAFCYVAGELPVEEAQAFERRLADDPAACESLSTAVELAQLSALALDTAALDTAALDTAALDTAATNAAATNAAAATSGRGQTSALDTGSERAAGSGPAGPSLNAGSVASLGPWRGGCAERVGRGRWWRYAAWLSCGALAGIGLTLAFVAARGESEGLGERRGAASGSAGTNGSGSAARVQHVQQLAMAWAQGRSTEHSGSESRLALSASGLEVPDGGLLQPEQLAAEQLAPVSELAADLQVSPDDESWAEWNAGSGDGWPASDDALSLNVPSWMLTAVSHQEQQEGP